MADGYQIAWTVAFACLNVAVCMLGCWRCFANNYLHWAAAATWILLIAQGINITKVNFIQSQRKIFLSSIWPNLVKHLVCNSGRRKVHMKQFPYTFARLDLSSPVYFIIH